MSKITNQDVEHIAQLARIELSEKEKPVFGEKLGEILNYVDELNGAPTNKVVSISQIIGLENVARSDEVTNPEIRDLMLENAPETKDGFIKVGKVFE